jgi:hypothetical protein
MPLVTGGAAVLGDGVLAKAENANVVFCQLVPWSFDYAKQYNVKRTYRRVSFLANRLLATMGAAGATPLLARFGSPVGAAGASPADGSAREGARGSSLEKRWLDGLYLDTPEEMDDPYRFFRW